MRAREHDLGNDHFDLLPFIAILMCTLGLLLLITMAMAALSIGPAAGEGWIPMSDPGRPTKTPLLIEWDGTTATVHRNGRRIPLQPGTPAFRELLDELAVAQGARYALFAVRPSGFESFQRFSYPFRERRISIGYEPIEQNRPVRLLKEGSKR